MGEERRSFKLRPGASFRVRHKDGPSTDPDFFSRASVFSVEVGSQVVPGRARGYYVDLGFKATAPSWPPEWLEPREDQLHVATIQWALGAYERFLGGQGEEWLGAARDAADYLIADQEADGGWVHRFPMPHTFPLRPPWLSGMAQGEGASLLVRIHAETGEERYADAAIRALRPFAFGVHEGGVRAALGDGPFFEEYPTAVPSLVLNGGIFALWGAYDVGVALGATESTQDWEDGVAALAENLHRWDTGHWSLYDLYPHPIPNIASSAYHALHITQLKAMQLIAPRPEFDSMIERFEGYADSRIEGVRAFARKSSFRLLVPRNSALAFRMPWTRGPSAKLGGAALHSPLSLCYHTVSDTWPSVLAVTREQFTDQLEHLKRRGFRGVTFAEAATQPEGPSGRVAITFDDSYRSMFENAFPILESMGFTATVFVPTDYMGSEEPMSWSGIEQWSSSPHARELMPTSWAELEQLRDAGWEIASHTCSHPYLPELGDAELLRELTESRARLRELLGTAGRTVAYPFGAEDSRVREAARAAGYEAAAGMRPGPPSRWCWPRVGIYPVDGMTARFRLKSSPLVRRMRASGLVRRLERVRYERRGRVS